MSNSEKSHLKQNLLKLDQSFANTFSSFSGRRCVLTRQLTSAPKWFLFLKKSPHCQSGCRCCSSSGQHRTPSAHSPSPIVNPSVCAAAETSLFFLLLLFLVFASSHCLLDSFRHGRPILFLFIVRISTHFNLFILLFDPRLLFSHHFPSDFLSAFFLPFFLSFLLFIPPFTHLPETVSTMKFRFLVCISFAFY